MRIIAGNLKGRRLYDLPRHVKTRPTLDRVRETAFQLISNRMDFEGIRVLDAFAGTGSLGLEAYSRGAGEVLFIEPDPTIFKILSENVNSLSNHDTEHLRVLNQHSPGIFDSFHQPFDLIFLDPPYEKNLYLPSLEKIIAHNLLAPEGVVVVEVDHRNLFEVPSSFQMIKEKKMGKVHVLFLERA